MTLTIHTFKKQCIVIVLIIITFLEQGFGMFGYNTWLKYKKNESVKREEEIQMLENAKKKCVDQIGPFFQNDNLLDNVRNGLLFESIRTISKDKTYKLGYFKELAENVNFENVELNGPKKWCKKEYKNNPDLCESAMKYLKIDSVDIDGKQAFIIIYLNWTEEHICIADLFGDEFPQFNVDDSLVKLTHILEKKKKIDAQFGIIKKYFQYHLEKLNLAKVNGLRSPYDYCASLLKEVYPKNNF